MRIVQRLPDREMMECWLCEGAPFEDRFWHPDFVVHQTAIIEVDPADFGRARPFTLAQKQQIMDTLDLSKYLDADPAHPGAVWRVNTWSEACLTFDTPSGRMAPGDVAILGGEICWKPDADGVVQRAPLADVTIARDGLDRITSVTRKAGGR